MSSRVLPPPPPPHLRVPPPPPPPPARKVPPPPPPRRTTAGNSVLQQKRRRPIPPPPPPPPPPPRDLLKEFPRMSLDSSEELASKAREMFHKCLNRSIPTGNLYSGGLGAYYLLLEQSRYHLLLLERQQQEMLSGGSKSGSTHKMSSSSKLATNHHNQSAPFRCKRLLKQALEGAQSATDRFKRSNSSNLSSQRSNISLLGGEWIGSHALLAVCYRRLEDFSKKQQQQEEEQRNDATTAETEHGDELASVASPPGVFRGDATTVSSVSSPPTGRTGAASGASLFSRRTTLKRTPSYKTVNSSTSMRSMRSTGMSTVATTNPRPRSERVVDRILNRLEKQHRASDEDDDTLTYYTMNSNYTNNTLSSMAVATVFNQDVLGGRAGALQAIWWLRKEFGDATLGQDLAVSMAVKILVEGLSTAASMGFNNDEGRPESIDDDSYLYSESDILFWLLDSQGSHKAYLGASRGVVGILHTLLGLSDGDWELVEDQAPNARRCVRNTIDVFLSTRHLVPNREEPGAAEQQQQQHEGELSETNRLAVLHERFFYSNTATEGGELKLVSGNLRPRLDAAQESNTTVDWFHGATGLAMLFLEASKVFRSKEYLQEAHSLCDAVIFPRGLAEQRKKSNPMGGRSTTTTTSMRNSSVRSGRAIDAPNKKGPVGLAGMAICFLQLSQLCSNDEPEMEGKGEEEAKTDAEKAGLPPKTSLRNVWKTRAALYAQHAHHEWINYLKAIPTANGTGNAYSLYEGMGGLISLLWQLSLSALPTAEDATPYSIFQMPLYGLGFVDTTTSTTDAIAEEESKPILLSYGDVTISETSVEIMRPLSPQKSRRTQPGWRPSKEALAESRRRRAAAEAEDRRRKAQAEEAKRLKEEQAKAERAVLNAQRRVELEARKKAQLLARKKAVEVARQKEQQESEKLAAKKEVEDKSKREALLLARRQAKERVEKKRKAKEAEELAKARAEAERKAIAAEKKRKAAEEEAKKRKALQEARLRRQRKEAEMAKQREEERKLKEEADRLRRAEELKRKEEFRKQRLAELRIRQQRKAQIEKEKEQERVVQEEAERKRREKELQMKEAERKKKDAERRRRAQIEKEKEQERSLQEDAEREKRTNELKAKEAERKKKDAERRRRLEVLKERRKKEEEALVQKQTKEAEQRKSSARKVLEAKEKRRLELREERLKMKKEREEERLRQELQQALDKEVEKQRREEQLRQKASEELKLQEAINAIHQLDNPLPPEIPPPSLSAAYSPSFAERKAVTPSHFSVPTRSSLFWSLQSDSNIGSSESYRPALIAADTPPSSAAVSTVLEESSSPTNPNPFIN